MVVWRSLFPRNQNSHLTWWAIDWPGKFIQSSWFVDCNNLGNLENLPKISFTKSGWWYHHILLYWSKKKMRFNKTLDRISPDTGWTLNKIFQSNTWVFPKIVVPQNGWFIMEIPIKMGWLGGKPPIFGNTHLGTFTCFFFKPPTTPAFLFFLSRKNKPPTGTAFQIYWISLEVPCHDV